jgi:peptidyl-prolyl cis-trans isomerase SurA
MYKRRLLTIFALTVACACATVANSQTLFTYNNTPVSKEEFLKAFNKNPDTTGNHAQKLRDYLSMYINFKLKLQEAYNEKLDAKDEFKAEAENFKSQLTENYMNSQANIGQLVHEAFVRSQQDILLAEVFVAAPQGTDTTAARQKIQQALAALNTGQSFENVTVEYSTDEYIKQQKGSLGYITAFTLPYELENIVYGLKPGGRSDIYHSSAGYHIFKVVSVRKAAGKRKIQQILLPVGTGFNDAEKQAVAQKADSLYALIQSGKKFEQFALQYANPNMNGQQNGISTVGVGMYSPDFEEVVFSLQKPGDISKPFVTAYGYNIIKLQEIVPVATKEDDVITQAALQQQVEGDGRLAMAKTNLIKQWLVTTKYKKGVYNDVDLWLYTDSALANSTKYPKKIDSAKVIFSFPGKKITAGDWVAYVNTVKQQGNAVTARKYPALLRDFTNQNCNAYYRAHIEEYNSAISEQMKEFNEANLLFAVMDKHVWSKASLDSAALLKYYTAHQANYTWAPSVTAVTVTASSKEIIDSVAQKIRANPANWRTITGAYNNLVTADSSRYESGQLPVKQTVPMQVGFATTPEKNDAGDAWTFAFVFKTYPQQTQRSFDDAKGMVINDYQQVLENDWVETLRKKYSVKVNEDVVRGLK